MKFFVIGGAGYIGAQFVRHAIHHGHECVVYDNLSRGHRHSVPEKTPFIEGDILDHDALLAALKNHESDTVVHFAAYALVGESVAKPEMYYENNVAGTLNLLDVMRQLEVKPSLVFSSTCAVYGTPKSLPMHEGLDLAPESPYGRTKWMCEQMIQDSCKAYGVKAIALRYFNACGADLEGRHGEDHDPETHLIPCIINAALSQAVFTIHGDDFETDDGTCVRDYIHIVDLAEAHLKAATHLERVASGFFDAFNLGVGKGYSVREVLQQTEQLLNIEVEKKVGPRRPGDPAELYADASKAQRELGFVAQNSDLTSILESAIRWHKRL